METITFYSYKGGVGRTLALANIAVYLSRFGQNVCVVDFDLEAPGMHYKLPHFFSTPIEHGLVDYIYEFTSNKNIPASLKKFRLKAGKTAETDGDIYLIPAGNVLSGEYWQKLASIDWHSLFYKEGGEGVPFFLELKEKINTEMKPDFLLIDSRTGITEMSGLCTSILPDKVVFLITNNKENIEGSRQILRGIQKTKRLKGQKPIKVNFVLTRIPIPRDKETRKIEENIIDDIINFLNEDTENLDEQLNISEISILHSDRDLELTEAVKLNQKNIIDIPLAKDYLMLFSKIIPDNIIESKIDSVIDSIITPDRLLEEPDKIQEELEAIAITYPHHKFIEKIIDFYFLRNVGTDKILNLFYDLWNLSRKFSDRLFEKLIQIFLKVNNLWSVNENILEIVEEYLKKNPENKAEVELKLADIYHYNYKYKDALNYYIKNLDKSEKKNEIIEKIFGMYSVEEK